MKTKFLSIFLITILGIASTTATAQSKNCSLVCNLTTGYVCPNSVTWKNNRQVYEDAELMTDIGYVKDNNGCWKLAGSKSKTITGDKSYLQRLYGKMKGAFSVRKKGF